MRAVPFGAAVGVLLVLPFAVPTEARAQRAAEFFKPRSASAGPVAIPLPADAVKRLKSGEGPQIQSALDDVRMSGKDGAPAVGTIVELLRQGLSTPLSQAAIETLGDTEDEAATETLGWYAHHRNIALRRAAIAALGKMHGGVAVTSLRTALSDPDGNVRGLAATELGSLRANPQVKETVADLFVALDHKVEEAASSIGQLCDASDCERLAGKLGSVPFDVMGEALDQVLLRSAKDLDDPTKINIIGRVRELGTGEANQFLRDLQSKWPSKASTHIRQAIDQAVMATASSPGGSHPPESTP